MKKIIAWLLLFIVVGCSNGDQSGVKTPASDSLKIPRGENAPAAKQSPATPGNAVNKPAEYDTHNFPVPPGKNPMNRKPPTESQSYYQLGITYAEKGNYKTAIKFMEMSVKADPKYEDAWIDLSNCYGMMKDYKMNIQILNKVLSINPNNTKALHNLVITYEFLGDSTKAKGYKEKLRVIEGK